MSLELDTLRDNDDVCVILNHCTGAVASFSCDFKDFKETLFSEFRIGEDKIKDYFSYDELINFFYDHDIEFSEEELRELGVD